jgi:hypothetical protein
MRIILLISSMIFLLAIGSAPALEYHMPVNIQSTVNPTVLMPGDEALITIDLQNGAAAYGTGKEAQGAILSTPLNRTTLKGTDQIKVISDDYSNLGMIGPTDKITIYYKIKASENMPDGTYLLDFSVLGGYDMVEINREIPIKVDSAALSLSRADVPTKPSISLNIANPREGMVNAVTIIPSSKGITFSPEEYYIGTMDSDEVFTINFDLDSENDAALTVGQANLSFTSRFKNGDTWHQSAAYFTSYVPPRDNSPQNNLMIPAGLAILVIVAIGFYLYRRRKISNSDSK